MHEGINNSVTKLRNFCVVFLILDLVLLRTRNEYCNIFVLKCLGFVETNIVMIVTSRPIVKLKFSLGIMP